MECIARDARDGTMHAGALERSPVARDEWLHGWQRRAIVSVSCPDLGAPHSGEAWERD